MSLTASELVRLNSAHIDSLSRAAREAGLSWKSGSLNKAGIIARLSEHPSIGRAALARIERENRDGRPVDLNATKKPAPIPANDWDDEPSTPKQADPVPATPANPDIEQAIGELWRAINGRTTRETTAQLAQALEQGITRLSARCDELEKRAPIAVKVQGNLPPFTFPEGELTHPKLPQLLQILLAGENAFLAGPASSGKTTAARQAATVLGKAFSREDFRLCATGAVADGFALLGYKDASGEYRRTEFREAVEHGHLFLFDEVDASASDALLVINMLDNGEIAFPDGLIRCHEHFRLIAGGNTDGSGATMQYSGRVRLDGAFLDRFALIHWDIDPRIESFLSRGDSLWLDAVQAIRAFADQRKILDVVATARATRRGPKFLANGMPRMQVLESTCKRGALADSWADVLRLPAVIAYLKG